MSHWLTPYIFLHDKPSSVFYAEEYKYVQYILFAIYIVEHKSLNGTSGNFGTSFLRLFFPDSVAEAGVRTGEVTGVLSGVSSENFLFFVLKATTSVLWASTILSKCSIEDTKSEVFKAEFCRLVCSNTTCSSISSGNSTTALVSSIQLQDIRDANGSKNFVRWLCFVSSENPETKYILLRAGRTILE